ncbi:hypothetical protein RFI_25542 [Reticulomyxa filosa]|uniref:Actin n=1 Tax=Reticulomyxa filosa TaxID=46433 RepID=X6MD68_RETFI|nr:hypothetical protein RFI_25542 [Reticulomyxa filosa]|eukprot:ETO11834.1 hypothetical protein RFI_25542 [Reticulomyxa filosa]
MEKLWEHGFRDQLRVQSAKQDVMLTQPTLNPTNNAEKTAEVMFEKFDVRSLCMASQSILGLYSSGSYLTYYVSFLFFKHEKPVGIHRLDLGGRDVTDYIAKLLSQSHNYEFTSPLDKEIIRQLKESVCHVANVDYFHELSQIEVKADKAVWYELPDGNVCKFFFGLSNEFRNVQIFFCTSCKTQKIDVGTVQVKGPEIMFQPKLLNIDQTPVQDLVNESIMKCELAMRRELFNNIVLTGGNTMFSGFQQRLSHELSKLVFKSVKVKVVSMSYRNYCVWIGAAVLADMPTFREQWMEKSNYSEKGAQFIHFKSF